MPDEGAWGSRMKRELDGFQGLNFSNKTWNGDKRLICTRRTVKEEKRGRETKENGKANRKTDVLRLNE